MPHLPTATWQSNWAAAAVTLYLVAALPSPAFSSYNREPDPVSTDPSTEPQIRVNAGQHVAPIRGLAASSAGDLLVTASLDKTVKVWSPIDGHLLTTLHIPIGPTDGFLHAVAMSPDGHMAYAGGYTGVSWDKTYSIYVFDLDKEIMKGRLPRLPSAVNHLAVSPSGKRLAACLGGSHGIVVWDTATFQIVGTDKTYVGGCERIAFDKDDRLSTTSEDGYIRLYDASGNLQKKVEAPGGKQPYGLAFSPDGKTIAVGYSGGLQAGDSDGPRIDLISSTDLRPVRKADTTGLYNPLAIVAWSPDGSLWAAGRATTGEGKRVVRRWTTAKLTSHVDVTLQSDTVSDFAWLSAQNAMAFATSDPSWGIIDASTNAVTKVVGRAGADFRGVFDGRFGISPDGMAVEVGTTFGGGDAVRFDLATQTIVPVRPSDPPLSQPQPADTVLSVTDWRNSRTPKYKGAPLPLDDDEVSRSVAVLPDGSGFFLGTNFSLRLFDSVGHLKSTVMMPSDVWGLTLTADGSTALAALGDGTLRWYRVNGSMIEEQMAFFIHRDQKRWVAWLPSGFFTHSPDGGADLVGFHINRSAKKAPDFVSVEQLYNRYYWPRSPALALRGDPGGELTTQLKQFGDASTVLVSKPAPTVEWVEYCAVAADQTVTSCHPVGTTVSTRDYRRVRSQSDGTEGPDGAEGTRNAASAELPPSTSAVRLRFRVKDQGGGIGTVDVVHNDKLISTTRDYTRDRAAVASPADTVLERDVSVQPGSNTVFMKAFDSQNDIYDQSSSVEFITATEPAGSKSAAAETGPALFVIVAAVDKYLPGNNSKGVYEDDQLHFPVADAKAFVSTLTSKAHPRYDNRVSVIELYDEAVSRASISAAFDELKRRKLTKDDRVVVYLAGHGTYDDESGYEFITYEDYLWPREHGFAGRTPADRVFGEDAFKENIAKVNNALVLFLLDTCHSGISAHAITNVSDKNDVAELQRGVDVVAHEVPGVLLVSAASRREKALDQYIGSRAATYTKQHGLFSVAVLMGLNGEPGLGDDETAADANGSVKAESFASFVANTVDILAQEVKHPQEGKVNDAHYDRKARFFLTRVEPKR